MDRVEAAELPEGRMINFDSSVEATVDENGNIHVTAAAPPGDAVERAAEAVLASIKAQRPEEQSQRQPYGGEHAVQAVGWLDCGEIASAALEAAGAIIYRDEYHEQAFGPAIAEAEAAWRDAEDKVREILEANEEPPLGMADTITHEVWKRAKLHFRKWIPQEIAAAGPWQGWRPIESAPKDGTPVLACWDAPKPEYKAIGVVRHDDFGHWMTLPGYYAKQPTHWQPLPCPPGSASPEPEGAEPAWTAPAVKHSTSPECAHPHWPGGDQSDALDEVVCPACRVERADYEGPGKHLDRCPNCGAYSDPECADQPDALGKAVELWLETRLGGVGLEVKFRRILELTVAEARAPLEARCAKLERWLADLQGHVIAANRRQDRLVETVTKLAQTVAKLAGRADKSDEK